MKNCLSYYVASGSEITPCNKIDKPLSGSHMFFHALTFVGSRGSRLNTRPFVRETRQVWMQWNKHVWSLFLYILPDFNLNRTEHVAKTFYPFSYTGFLKTKWRQRQTFERHNVPTASLSAQSFREQNHRRMISQGRNAFPCIVLQNNQGPDRLCQIKRHVQTARESHDLNVGFKLRLQTASRDEFLCKNSGLQIFGERYDVHNNVAYIMTKL